MLSSYATNKGNAWMSRVVVYLSPKSKALHGTYDGYGRIEGGSGYFDEDREDGLANAQNPCCYHRACWEAAGKPKHTGRSRDSADQGYFFNDPCHNMPKPKTAADLPAKPVNYSMIGGIGAGAAFSRVLWESNENGDPKYGGMLHGPWHPLTRRLAKGLVMQRLWRQVERKFKQGRAVPAIQEVEAAAEQIIG